MIANDRIKDKQQTLDMMGAASCNVKPREVVGQLVHEPTDTSISVYKPIGKFKAWMLYKCFGLKYKKI